MMQDRLPNGASVSRLWSNNKTELLALFQYESDAELFACQRLRDDIRHQLCNSSYLIASTYSGRVVVQTREDLKEPMP